MDRVVWKAWLVWVACFLVALISGLMAPAWAIDGGLDPAFNPGAGASNLPQIRGKTTYADGTNRYLLFGDFTTMNGTAVNSLARFDVAGNLDTSFTPPITGEIRWAMIYPDGKILISGRFTVGSGSNVYYNLARLDSYGNVDTNFTSTFDQYGVLNSFGVLSDGKILIGGLSVRVKGDTAAYYQLRLNGNGTVDTTYPKFSAPGGYAYSTFLLNDDPANPNRLRQFGTFPDIVPGHTGYMITLYNNGTLQEAVTEATVNGTITGYAFQSDGKVAWIGQFSEGTGCTRNYIARVNSDYSLLDTTFDPGSSFNARPRSIITRSDGKIVVSGNFSAYNGTPVGHIARLTGTGALDLSFQGTADDTINRLSTSGSGFRLDGFFRNVNGSPRAGLAELDSNGNLTSTYAGLTNTNSRKGLVYALTLQPDGKILAGGDFTGAGGKYHRGLGRLNQDGSLDATFMFAGADGYIRSIALQADGSILVGGFFGELENLGRTSLGRLTSTGYIDRAFNPVIAKTDGSLCELYRVMTLSDGRILIAGNFDKINSIARSQMAFLNADGSLDSSFTSRIAITNGSDIIPRAVIPISDSRYLVAGLVTLQGLPRGFLCRLLKDGTLDANFGPPVGSSSPSPNVIITGGEVRDMGLQPDGRILICGDLVQIIDGSLSNPLVGSVVRFSADGAFDSSFQYSGLDIINCLAVQTNGRILIGGQVLSRLLPDGALDTFFTSTLMPDPVWAIALRPNGKRAVIGGLFTSYQGVNRPGLAQIKTGPAALPAQLLLLN